MKKVKITKSLSKKEIIEKAKFIYDVQQKGHSVLRWKNDTIEDVKKQIQSNLPKKGTVISMENAQIHYISLPYFAGWDSMKYGSSFCIDIVNGIVSIGTIQNIGHR